MKRGASLLAVALATLPANLALAAGTYSGFGWSVSWDDNIDLTFLGTTPDTLVFQLFTLHNTPPSTTTQLLQPISITFTRTSPSALPRIAIEDAHIFNDTASTWTGFQFALSSLTSAPVTFDPLASASFDTTPFPTKTWTDTTLTLSGGSLPATFGLDEWRPGRQTGALFIIPDPSPSQLQTFTLTQSPVIPEPSSSILLASLPLLSLRRRRS